MHRQKQRFLANEEHQHCKQPLSQTTASVKRRFWGVGGRADQKAHIMLSKFAILLKRDVWQWLKIACVACVCRYRSLQCQALEGILAGKEIDWFVTSSSSTGCKGDCWSLNGECVLAVVWVKLQVGSSPTWNCEMHAHKLSFDRTV